MYSEVKTNKVGYITKWFDKNIGTDYEIDTYDEEVTVITWFDISMRESRLLDDYLTSRDYYKSIDYEGEE